MCVKNCITDRFIFFTNPFIVSRPSIRLLDLDQTLTNFLEFTNPQFINYPFQECWPKFKNTFCGSVVVKLKRWEEREHNFDLKSREIRISQSILFSKVFLKWGTKNWVGGKQCQGELDFVVRNCDKLRHLHRWFLKPCVWLSPLLHSKTLLVLSSFIHLIQVIAKILILLSMGQNLNYCVFRAHHVAFNWKPERTTSLPTTFLLPMDLRSEHYLRG